MTRSPAFARQARSTVPGDIVNEIQRQIASGMLKEGNQLPPANELAATLGVNRTSLWAALHRLSALGESTSRWVSGGRLAWREGRGPDPPHPGQDFHETGRD